MAEERIEGVNPTRMELLQIRKRLEIADKGHELLEEKRDALVEKFFKIIDQRNELKEEIDEQFDQAFQSLLQTEMLMGEYQVEEIAGILPAVGKVDFETENVMGVKIPKMVYEEEEKEKSTMYDFMDTCAEFDKAQQRFKDIVSKLIDLADLEGGINALASEIEKTKRRVNVLENNLIPRLENTRDYIEMQLEEREREDFLRRKRIKALMEEE